MNLYEITNGWTGESYIRAYAWAADEPEALRLYRARHGDERVGTGDGRPRVELLFRGDAEAFVMDKSDHGWQE